MKAKYTNQLCFMYPNPVQLQVLEARSSVCYLALFASFHAVEGQSKIRVLLPPKISPL